MENDVAAAPATEFAGTARFDVRRRLGAGAMGVVYEAWDRVRSEFVALKTLRHLDAAAIYRLKQEFRALADVAHPNLISLHELLVEDEHWFITMELVRGEDFLSWVRPGWSYRPVTTQLSEEETMVPGRGRARPAAGAQGPGVLDEGRFRAALLQLCGAIATLHEAGRVHRDLKPSNVLVDPTGRVAVLDFGLAVDLRHTAAGRSLEAGIAGTPEYMAPEQAALETVGAPADWYAVGVMMYEALTGRTPFAGRQLQVLMDKQHRVPVEPLELAPEAPVDLCSLCADLLRRQPESRPGAAEILRRLGGAGSQSSPPSVPSVGRVPLVGQLPVLEALRAAFADVQRGQPATVLLHGAAGVGVSTVARGFAEAVEAEARAVVLLGRCYERESVPFKGLDSLVDALSRHLRRLPRAEVDALLPRDVHALVRMFPVLRRVDAVADAPRRSSETPDPQELRSRAATALRELLGRIADRRPLVLLIDGLQWSDRDSLALLTEVLRGPDAPPMLLVGCYRRSLEEADSSALPVYLEAPEPLSETRAQLAAICAVREIEVQALGGADARRLASLLLSRAGLPLALEESVARESRGSPFLLHELVRALQTAEDDERPGASEVTLARAIGMRLEQLPAPARQLLEVVSVSGGPTVTAVAAQAAGLDGDPRATFSLLRAAHLVRTSVDGERVEPYHDRIRETVVGAMTPPRQIEAHLKLAAALEARGGAAHAAALALHYRAAGHLHRAAEFAALAAERAAETLAFERAARLYQLALSLRPPEPAWGLELEMRQGDALVAAGLGARAAEIYLAAAARPWATRAQTIELRRRAAEQYLRSGHIDDGLEVLRSVLAAYGMRIASTPRRALFSLLVRRAQVRLRGTRVVPRDVSQVSAEELARIDVCWAGAVGLAMVDTIRGSAFQAEHLLLSLRAGEPVRIARAFALEAPFAAVTGKPRARRAAARLVGQAEDLARRLDQPQITALAGLTAAVVDFLGGRWRSCHRQAEEAATIFRDRCTGVAWELSNCQLFSLWSLFYLGELGELRRRAETLRREAVNRGDLYAATIFRTGLTNLGLLVGDDEAGARSEVGEVSAHWSQQGFHFQHYWGVLAEGLINLYAGHGAAAHERIERLWPQLQRALMLRIQNVAVEATHLRARSNLATLDGSSADAGRIAAAENQARALAATPAPWAQALGSIVSAGCALARGDKAAAGLFGAAAEKLDALDMALFAAAARRRRGEASGDSTLVAAADEMMARQGIVNPRRMAALLAPGG